MSQTAKLFVQRPKSSGPTARCLSDLTPKEVFIRKDPDHG